MPFLGARISWRTMSARLPCPPLPGGRPPRLPAARARGGRLSFDPWRPGRIRIRVQPSSDPIAGDFRWRTRRWVHLPPSDGIERPMRRDRFLSSRDSFSRPSLFRSCHPTGNADKNGFIRHAKDVPHRGTCNNALPEVARYSKKLELLLPELSVIRKLEHILPIPIRCPTPQAYRADGPFVRISGKAKKNSGKLRILVHLGPQYSDDEAALNRSCFNLSSGRAQLKVPTQPRRSRSAESRVRDG